MLGKVDTFGINENFGAPEKTLSINFSKAKTKFCLSFHYNSDSSYLFLNGIKSISLKQINMSIFQIKFV